MVDWDKNHHSNKPIQDSFHYFTHTKGIRSTSIVDWGKNITTDKPIQDSFHYTTHTQRE